jgi:hypothetical protein
MTPALFTDRLSAQSYNTSNRTGQAFHRSRVSLGVAGHWLHLAAVLSPLVIGEVIKDPEKKWRTIRLASVGFAILSEALWTHRLEKKRKEEEERERTYPPLGSY